MSIEELDELIRQASKAQSDFTVLSFGGWITVSSDKILAALKELRTIKNNGSTSDSQ